MDPVPSLEVLGNLVISNASSYQTHPFRNLLVAAGRWATPADNDHRFQGRDSSPCPARLNEVGNMSRADRFPYHDSWLHQVSIFKHEGKVESKATSPGRASLKIFQFIPSKLGWIWFIPDGCPMSSIPNNLLRYIYMALFYKKYAHRR